MKKKLGFALLSIFFLSAISGCNKPGDPSSYGSAGKKYAQVSINLNGNASLLSQSSRNLSSSFTRKTTGNDPALFSAITKSNSALSGLPTQTLTALIVAVDADSVFLEDYNALEYWHDRQIVDLSTSTVSLTLPLDTSIILFEYTFNSAFSLDQLEATTQLVATYAKLGPFTITSDTTRIELQATLYRALSASFENLMDEGSYIIDEDEDEGKMVFSYEKINWKTLAFERYTFDSATRTFIADSGKSGYELIDNEWQESEFLNSTLDRIDYNNYKVYYTSPDFTGTLTEVIDLTAETVPDQEGDKESDEKEEGIQTSDFSAGAIAYILEIGGLTENEYRLEEIAESHDGNDIQYNALADFISVHTLSLHSAFSCKDNDGKTCLVFDSYTSGKTSGTIYEEIRDDSHTLVSTSSAGTWRIQTIQTKDLLLYTPDDTSYYYDGLYAEFWSVYDGKVWRGNYQVTSSTSDQVMQMASFNETAIADFTRFLVSAPDDWFTSDSSNDEGSTSSQNWDQTRRDNFAWGP